MVIEIESPQKKRCFYPRKSAIPDTAGHVTYRPCLPLLLRSLEYYEALSDDGHLKRDTYYT